MKSWNNSLAALTLGLGVAALSGAAYVFTRGFDPTAQLDDGPSVAAAAPPTPLVRDQAIGRAAQVTPRPDGLRELSVVAPGEILLVDQRRGLAAHLRAVGLSLNVPDAMSYAGRREGKLMVLSGASAPGTGFFLFSEKNGAKLGGAPKKFLRDYFKGSIDPVFDDAESTFLSRFAGSMTWLRGLANGGQRFDAYLIRGPRRGFTHLLFIYDPTVANATRRLMVDSIRLTR